MYILREIIEKTTFPKRKQTNGTKYLYIGSSERCSVRLLGSMYSCNRIYLNPKASLNYYFNETELKILLSGKDKILEHGNKNASFKATFINAGKKTEEAKRFLNSAMDNFKIFKNNEPDAYLINCLTREGQFMGATSVCNIKILMLAKGMMNSMRNIYGENLDDMSGIWGRDLIMSRMVTRDDTRPILTIPVIPVQPISINPNAIRSIHDILGDLGRNLAEEVPMSLQPVPISFISNNDLTYLKDEEIQYITDNGLLDIKESIEFENKRTLKKGSGYYITKYEELGDKIPIVKFKGKLQEQLVEMEESQEILDVESNINQIPEELLGNDKEYNNPILNLEL